jgi:hypothetical protein
VKLKKRKPFKLYFKGGTIVMAAYNSFIHPKSTVEIDMITSVSKFINVKFNCVQQRISRLVLGDNLGRIIWIK